MNLKEKKNNLVWPSLFPLFQPKDFPQFETSVSTCIFAMFILNGCEHSPRLFEACHHCHLCCYVPKVWINYRKHEHIGYVLPHFTTLHCDSAPALSLLKHTTSSRNNIGQKCEDNYGLWVLNEIIKRMYPESLKKIVGAVWELPAK